jgi:hypothetical protein
MTTSTLSPPFSAPDHCVPMLAQRGYVLLSPQGVEQLSGCTVAQLNAWVPSWNDLPPDLYLKDGGRYRSRRHSCFVVRGAQVEQVPHRSHWQPLSYNALHGGMERHFEPMSANVVGQAPWAQLLQWMGAVCSARKGEQAWFVEAHQFRIDTSDGIGRPTPEGAHRDGVDFVAVFLVGRDGVKGGETRVFDADGPNGQRFTLTEPWSLMLLDDEQVIHESTPIQPVAEAGGGWRDTLVLTFRKGGFQAQGPQA